MNEEIPKELQDFDFAEIGNNQQNIWRLRDELNATRRWLRENTVDVEEDEDDYQLNYPKEGLIEVDLKLKEGVSITKNGKYYIPGKGFIKEADAYES